MKATTNTKRAKRPARKPLFIIRAERSFRRVARKVREEHKRMGLEPLVWN